MTDKQNHFSTNNVLCLYPFCIQVATDGSNEVKIWITHLDDVARNRQRGAQKAAETRKKKSHSACTSDTSQQSTISQEKVYYCRVCQEQYVEYTETVETWIACDSCSNWYHYSCAGLTSVKCVISVLMSYMNDCCQSSIRSSFFH